MPRPVTFIHASPVANTQERNLITNLNKLFAEIRQDVDALKERPSFRGDINMQGFRITNVGQSKDRTDVANRGELEDNALFKNANDQHVANSSVVAKDGVRSLRRAREANELITLGQTRELVDTVGGGSSPTTGSYPFTTLTLADGINSNVVLSGGVAYRITGPTSAFTVGGLHIDALMTNPDGTYVILFNATGLAMTVAHQSSAAGMMSTPQNRINTVSGSGGIVTSGSGVVTFIYDSNSAKWIVVSVVL